MCERNADVVHVSFTEAPRLSARRGGSFQQPPVLFDFQPCLVFESPGSTLHHFPSEADEKCHSLVVLCADKGEFTHCVRASRLLSVA